ncbi:hypothetical protein PRZ48_006370 [Zasmidium cellare]|uniref:DUF1907 domain-containing protein n=1 Tax=Zasmidium cellare TaxID=395010 RepID=A0ABR0EQ45_ZASCE|nr:hypothetical protein PRZ48_006370 [Zasmidium cellare]
MPTQQYPLSPPSLDELAQVLKPALESNYKDSSISVSQCPDLRQSPYHLATSGLTGNESIADIGGQPNLFPTPRLDCKWSLLNLAREMQMSPSGGHLLGAGAGPFHVIGMNSELAPNLSWKDSFDNLENKTYYTKFEDPPGKASCEPSPTPDCALMINLYGSSGLPGPVLKITAKGRRGNEKSFAELLRHTLHAHYGDARPISLGGVFLLKAGKAKFHVMPDFPPSSQLPFKDPKQLNDWLTYHDFAGPMVCLTVFHSADPDKRMGLRMEHTHCFEAGGGGRGGHYHYDLDEGDGEEVVYEAYLNAAKVIYRIDRPEVTLERDLHD